MKARAVSGIDPEVGLAEAARQIVAVRSEELYSLAAGAVSGEDVVALHDMRIAAKRLRYVLELIGFCLGDVAAEAEGRMRELQTVIGDIHDCDVLLERLARSERAGRKGMRRLATRLELRRRQLFGEFIRLWGAIELSGLRERIVAATSYSPNGAGGAP
jgi:CHAD domain-containing protein